MVDNSRIVAASAGVDDGILAVDLTLQVRTDATGFKRCIQVVAVDTTNSITSVFKDARVNSDVLFREQFTAGESCLDDRMR